MRSLLSALQPGSPSLPPGSRTGRVPMLRPWDHRTASPSGGLAICFKEGQRGDGAVSGASVLPVAWEGHAEASVPGATTHCVPSNDSCGGQGSETRAGPRWSLLGGRGSLPVHLLASSHAAALGILGLWSLQPLPRLVCPLPSSSLTGHLLLHWAALTQGAQVHLDLDFI